MCRFRHFLAIPRDSTLPDYLIPKFRGPNKREKDNYLKCSFSIVFKKIFRLIRKNFFRSSK